MSLVRWLHISDIHLGYSTLYTELARSSFIPYLKTLSSVFQPTMMFLTGDYKYAPQGNDISDAQIVQRIREIQNVSGVQDSEVFMVPGNHDIERDGTIRTLVIDDIYSRYIHNDGKIPLEYIDFLHQSMEKYIGLYNNTIDGLWSDCKENFHFVRETADLNIVHLNTALLYSKTHGDGDLLIGSYYIEKILQRCNKSKKTVVLGHHPLAVLHPNERANTISVFDQNGISLYLNGHTHVFSVNAIKDRNCEFSCPTSMDRDERTNSPCQIGFFVGEIDTLTGTGFVEAHSWDEFMKNWGVYERFGNSIQPGRKEFS